MCDNETPPLFSPPYAQKGGHMHYIKRKRTQEEREEEEEERAGKNTKTQKTT